MPNFWRTISHRRIFLKKFPLNMLILGQKSCILGPTIFKIPQQNWYYSTYLGTYEIEAFNSPFRFWGWGGEDDDLFKRVKTEKLTIFRENQELGRFKARKLYRKPRRVVKWSESTKKWLFWQFSCKAAVDRYSSRFEFQLPYLNPILVNNMLQKWTLNRLLLGFHSMIALSGPPIKPPWFKILITKEDPIL